MEAAFAGANDFAEREKDGFMGNFQYIVNRLLFRRPSCALVLPESHDRSIAPRTPIQASYRQLALPVFATALKLWLLRQYLSPP
jgi:hypothetical protein